MVWQFVDVFKRVITSNKIQDDDFADRLNHRYTVAFLILFCILVGSTQFVGSPIACWAPAQFTGAMVQYANYICWIANTYFVPTDDFLPNPKEPRQYRINYYQWVPFILALMAFLFYFPFIVWHFFAKPSGLDAKTVMKILSSMDASSSESRDKTMRNAVKLIDRAIDYHRDYYDYTFLGRLRRRISRCFLPNMRSGAYISILYMFVKILYLANVCGQFFLLNAFMGPNFNIYGFEVIRDLLQGKDFWESPRFPRVTMCDFVIRTLGENNHRNTIQCTLPINLFNEKIFIFIWFWLCAVAALTVYSFLVWFFTFTSSSRISFIKRYLKVNDRLGGYVHHHHHSSTTSSSTTVDAKIFDAFLFEYLKLDGVFLLRIVKKNTNDIVVGELVCALWDHFKRYPKFASMIQNHQGDDSMQKETEKLNGVQPNGDTIPNGYHHN
jgi:innexin